MDLCLALDIGGTKIGCALVDDLGRVSGYRRVLMPTHTSAEIVFEAITSTMGTVLALANEPPIVCGIAIGGPMSKGGEFVSPLNIPAWRGFALRSRVAESCGLPTFIDNDAKALALAEGWVGAAKGVDNYMAMVVSTGVGGGLVLDGMLANGRLGNAGHVGHINVVDGGRICGCGATGCLEAEASGLAIEAITGEPAQMADQPMKERTGRLTGKACASVANLCDLDLILVAGSVALGFGEPFFKAAQAALSAGAKLDYSKEALIKPGGLGSDGPVVGAGAVGWRGLGLPLLAALGARP